MSKQKELREALIEETEFTVKTPNGGFMITDDDGAIEVQDEFHRWHRNWPDLEETIIALCAELGFPPKEIGHVVDSLINTGEYEISHIEWKMLF